MPETYLVGLDASYAAFGVAILRVDKPRTYQVVKRETISSTVPPCFPGCRLEAIVRLVLTLVSENVPNGKTVRFAIENYAFNSKFKRESMGEIGGAIKLRVYETFSQECELVTPRAVKVLACPHWHGLSKANWLAARKVGKFKMSLPDKAGVIAGLQRRFKDIVHHDAEADATLAALNVGISAKLIRADAVRA